MGINILFMNANVDLFHDSTKNSSGILTSESNEMDLNILIPVVDNNNHKVVDARFLHASSSKEGFYVMDKRSYI